MSANPQHSEFAAGARWKKRARVSAACCLLAAIGVRSLLAHSHGPAPAPAAPDLYPVTPRVLSYTLPPDNVIVAGVQPGSAAARAGVRAGDVLVSYAGRPLASPFTLTAAEINCPHAAQITLVAKRGGRMLTFTVPPGEEKGILARPVLPPSVLASYQAGETQFAAHNGLAGLVRWRAAFMESAAAGDANACGWLAFQIAGHWQKPAASDGGGKNAPDARTWLQCAWECVRGGQDNAAQAKVLFDLANQNANVENDEATVWALNQAYAAAMLDGDRTWAAAFRVVQAHIILTQYGRDMISLPPNAKVQAERLIEARRCLNEAAHFPDGTQGISVVIMQGYDALGQFSIAQHRFSTAQKDYESALAVSERDAPRSAQTADILQKLGDLAALGLDTLGAQRYLRAALALSQGADAPSRQRRGAIYSGLGAALAVQGDLEQANHYLQQALDGYSQESAVHPLERANCLLLLGLVATLQKRLPEAGTYCDQALTLQRQLSLPAEQQASILDISGYVAASEKHLPEARRRFEEALHLWQAVTPDGSEGMATSLNGLGMAAYNEGDLNEARARFQQARDIGRKCKSGMAQDATAVANLGRVYLKQNQPRQALPLIQEAIARLETRRTRLPDLEARALFMEQYASPFADLMQTYMMLGQPDRAFDTLERMRARSLADKLAACRQTSAQNIALPRSIDLPTAQKALPDGVLALSYGLNGDSVYVFALTNADFHVYTLPVPQERLTAKIEQARALIADAHSTTQMTDGILTDLYDDLMRPAQAQITRARSLVICPPDGLNLPFAALKPAPGRYLIEDKPITTVASLTVYRSLRAYTPPARPSLVALGDPACDAAAAPLRDENTPSGPMGAVMQRLPETGRTAQKLSALYAPRATVLLQDQATPRNLLAQIRTAGLIQIGCHAVADAQNPFGSWLALTPDGRAGSGRLYASQILSQKLDARLVVLWGCGTALGKEEKYEGMEGLGRAFQTAGAQNVLTTLWEVQPQETAPLIESFYRAYKNKTGGASLAASLRQAQVAALKTDPRPYAWAAFVLDGVGE